MFHFQVQGQHEQHQIYQEEEIYVNIQILSAGLHTYCINSFRRNWITNTYRKKGSKKSFVNVLILSLLILFDQTFDKLYCTY